MIWSWSRAWLSDRVILVRLTSVVEELEIGSVSGELIEGDLGRLPVEGNASIMGVGSKLVPSCARFIF